MHVSDFLSANNVLDAVRFREKSRLLTELAGHLADQLTLPTGMVADEILKRDALGSTGIGGGVSIPHARLREVTRPIGLLARLKTPIDFDAIDGEPVDIVFLLLLPASSQLDQLNALAAVARKLRDPAVLAKLRGASGSTALFEAFVLEP